MKKLWSAILASVFLFTAISCSDDPDDKEPPITQEVVVNTVMSGTWRITLFSENGTLKTENFTDFSFAFQAANLLSATNITNTYNGSWSANTIAGTPENPVNSLGFKIIFTAPQTLVPLSKNWQIIQSSASKLQLRFINGGDVSDDLLTFEKN